jgi:hypothetical protein
MAYIGNIPAEKYTNLAVQHFSVSATTGYTLTHSVTNENGIALFINNVRQEPGGSYAYTAAGTTLTLSAATAGTDTMYCVYLGKSVGTISPPDGSVNSAKIVDGSITDGDLAGSISSAKITSLDATKITGTIDSAQLATGSVDLAHLSATGTPTASLALKGDNSWGTAGGPSLGTNAIIRTNALTIAETFAFAGTENGMTIGPITMSSGVITVTSPSTWTII